MLEVKNRSEDFNGVASRLKTSSSGATGVTGGGKRVKYKMPYNPEQEREPDRLHIFDINDGEHLYTGPPIDKKALYGDI